MSFRRLPVLLAACVAATASADPVGLVAREAFRLHYPDGGLSPFTTLVALPGQDRALVGATDLGFPLGSSVYAVVKLGGADAGTLVDTVELPGGAAGYFPQQILRAGGTGPSSTYWTFYAAGLAGALGSLDSEQLQVFPVFNRSFDEGATLGSDPSGHLRAVGVDLNGNVTSFTFSVRDGGVDAQTGASISPGPGVTAPSTAFSPPGSDEVFAFAGSPNTALHGRFTNPDAGLDSIGPVPDSPVVFASAAYTYLIGFTTSPGIFEVSELTSSGVISRGTFYVIVDGSCSSPDCGSQSLALQALREAFPGYPSGALLFTGYGTPVGVQQIVLLGWDTLATALSLRTDASPGPDTALAASSGGTGGDGNPVEGTPHGPGLAGSGAGGCSASESTAFPVAALALLAVVAFRPRRRAASRIRPR